MQNIFFHGFRRDLRTAAMGHHRHAALLVALPGPGLAVIRTPSQHPRAARLAARTLGALP